MLKYPLLFNELFEAGMMDVEPVKFQFNRDISKVKPVVMKLRPLAHKELEVVQDWIEKALRDKIIEPSEGTWRAQVFPVQKPSGIDEEGRPKKKWRIGWHAIVFL